MKSYFSEILYSFMPVELEILVGEVGKNKLSLPIVILFIIDVFYLLPEIFVAEMLGLHFQ